MIRLLAAGILVVPGAARAAEPRDPLAKASRLLASGDAAAALEQLRPYVAANPESADGHRLLGVSYALIPQRSLALQALQRAVELAPDDPANPLAFAQALARFGDAPRAREQYLRALELDGSLAAAHEGLGLLLALEGDLEGAADRFSRAVERMDGDPNRARVLYLLGKAQSQLGRTDEAIASLRAATGLAPALAPAYLEWARLLAEQPAEADAERVFVRAAELLPEDAEAQRLLGLFHLRAGRAESAAPPLRRALEIDPEDRAAALALGRALRATGETDEARRLMTEQAERNEGRALSDAAIAEAGRLNNEGIELEQVRRYEDALEKYRAALAIAPGDIRFRRNAALVLGRLSRWEEAKAELREVLRLAPGDPDATKALYVALEQAPDPQ